MAEFVLAADVGGTNLRMAVVSGDGRLMHRERCRTPHGTDPYVIVEAIGDLARRCREATGVSIGSLGVAAPVIMDQARGIVARAPNLPMLDGFDLDRSLETSSGLAIVLENDATAAAIGEHWLGASRGVENSVCVTLGTGVGGGLILNGAAFRGPDGTAGEIGHICVEPDGRPCGCGGRGCLEQYASATAVVRRFEELSGTVGLGSAASRDEITAEDVYNAAVAGNRTALDSLHEAGRYLGIALAGVINLLNPEVVVISGGMSAAWDVFVGETMDQISKRAFPQPALRAKLVRARLGDDAGILGVASLAFAAEHQGL